MTQIRTKKATPSTTQRSQRSDAPTRTNSLLKGAVYFLMASPLSALARSLAPAPGPSQALAPRAPQVGCQPVAYGHARQLHDGFTADSYIAWSDDACAPRSAALLSNSEIDPSGHFGGVLHELIYQDHGKDVVCTGSTAEHPGIGNSVNHYQLDDGSFDSDSSLEHAGTGSTVLQGAHHALHAYQWSYPVNGHNISLFVHWLFGTGMTHPVYAATYDLSAIPANALSADVRTPYGDIDFDGGQDTRVTGVEWGSDRKFRSIPQGGINIMQDGWTHESPNGVPYALIYSADADREMGYVSTHTLARQDAGAGDFYTQGDTRNLSGPMPVDYTWVHQAGQYDYATNPRSKRLAWQLNYGALGQESYDNFLHTQKLSGWPYHSHSVGVVFGARSQRAVDAQAAHVMAMSHATLSAHRGVKVLSEGPAGIHRKDVMPYVPAGYNKVYGTFELAAQGNTRDLDFDVRTTQGALQNFMVRVHAWNTSGLPNTVRVNGAKLQRNAAPGYFASVGEEADGKMLWLTVVPGPPKHGLSKGAVAGIVVGSVAGALTLGATAAACTVYRRRRVAPPLPSIELS